MDFPGGSDGKARQIFHLVFKLAKEFVPKRVWLVYLELHRQLNGRLKLSLTLKPGCGLQTHRKSTSQRPWLSLLLELLLTLKRIWTLKRW